MQFSQGISHIILTRRRAQMGLCKFLPPQTACAAHAPQFIVLLFRAWAVRALVISVLSSLVSETQKEKYN